MNIRTKLRFLSNELILKILEESREILIKIGTGIHSRKILSLLAYSGADVTSQNVIDCGRYGISVKFISMTLAGFMPPVTELSGVDEYGYDDGNTVESVEKLIN